MFVPANFLLAMAAVIDWGLWLVMILIVVHAVLSWVNADPRNPIVSTIRQMAEPLLWSVRGFLSRRRIPYVAGMLDLSPLIIFAAIIFLRVFLVGSLRQWAVSMMPY